ncbi:MAG: RNHCP domain-containing protein, partial [Candidatus Dormibacteraceae bacterium]
DFECENCRSAVTGNGYTNHCPHCLHSKHVDINPGDRLAKCGGLMSPIAVTIARDEYVITHRCAICGHLQRNRGAAEDDLQQLLLLAAVPTLINSNRRQHNDRRPYSSQD